MSLEEIQREYDLIKNDTSKIAAIEQLENFAEKKFGVDLFTGKSEKSNDLNITDRIADVAKAVPRGAYNVLEGVIDAPRDIVGLGADLIEKGYQKVTGNEQLYDDRTRASIDRVTGNRNVGAIEEISNQTVGETLLNPPRLSQFRKDVPALDNFVNQEPKTTAGAVTERITEFVPFAGKNVVTQGIIPAITSYFAGQFEGIKGTNLQFPVELATAIFSPTIAKRVISPKGGDLGGATQQQIALLEKEGVVPTAGLLTDDVNIKAWEEATSAGKNLQEAAYEAFSRAALKRIGIDANRATPEMLEAVYKQLQVNFDNSIGSINPQRAKIIPTKKDLKDFSQILGTYGGQVSPNMAAPIFREIDNALKASIQSNQSLTANQMRRFHNTLNNMTRSGDVDGNFARETLPLIKDLINRNLTAEQSRQWIKTNKTYRDFLAIEKSLMKAGDATSGLITPQNLRTSTGTVFKKDYLFGKSDLSNLAKAGSVVLKPLPQSGTQPRLSAVGQGGSGTDAMRFGAATYGYTLDPGMAATAATAGSLFSPIRNRVVASPLGQRYLKNQTITDLEKNNLLRMLAATTIPR